MKGQARKTQHNLTRRIDRQKMRLFLIYILLRTDETPFGKFSKLWKVF